MTLALPPIILDKLNQSSAGRGWLRELPNHVSTLCQRWAIEVDDRPLDGGSEAVVLNAIGANGHEMVVKLGIPGSDLMGGELTVLRAAGGRGYATLIAEDLELSAILMERLGPPIASLGLTPDAEIDALADATARAWTSAPAHVGGLMSGAEKARVLAVFIEESWQALGQPTSKASVELARRYCRERAEAHAQANAVLVHGDPHAQNLLLPRAFDRDSEPLSRCKFVDPDGLMAEPAYDLGVILRDTDDEILNGPSASIGLGRAERLGETAGIDPSAIWHWAFIERMSTGLYLRQLGLAAYSSRLLTVAERWARAG